MIVVMTLYVLVARGFDVIHVANPPDCLVVVTAIYKLIGKKIIFDQHDLSPELYVNKFPQPKRLVLRLLLLLEQLSYKLADHTIVTNESYRDIAISRGVQSESKVTGGQENASVEHLDDRSFRRLHLRFRPPVLRLRLNSTADSDVPIRFISDDRVICQLVRKLLQ